MKRKPEHVRDCLDTKIMSRKGVSVLSDAFHLYRNCRMLDTCSSAPNNGHTPRPRARCRDDEPPKVYLSDGIGFSFLISVPIAGVRSVGIRDGSQTRLRVLTRVTGRRNRLANDISYAVIVLRRRTSASGETCDFVRSLTFPRQYRIKNIVRGRSPEIDPVPTCNIRVRTDSPTCHERTRKPRECETRT